MTATVASDNNSYGVWQELTPTSERPHARVGHTAHAVIGDSHDSAPKLLLLGGANLSTTKGDLYSLELSEKEYRAFSVLTDLPELNRYEQASAILSDKRLLVFGGATQSGPLKSMCTVDFCGTQTGACVQSTGACLAEFLDTERTQHTSACLTEFDQLLVFAGAGFGDQPVSDCKLHLYDSLTNRWHSLKPSGKIPQARFGHLAIYQMYCGCSHTIKEHRVPSGTLFLHGGMAGTMFFGDFYKLEFGETLNEAVWTEIIPSSTASVQSERSSLKRVDHCTSLLDVTEYCQSTDGPCPRAAHGGACLIGRYQHIDSGLFEFNVFIFGGVSHSGALSDLFCFSTATLQWTEIIPDGLRPRPRLDFACCHFRRSAHPSGTARDVWQDLLFVHGGMNSDGTLFDDAWTLLLREGRYPDTCSP